MRERAYGVDEGKEHDSVGGELVPSVDGMAGVRVAGAGRGKFAGGEGAQDDPESVAAAL